MASNFPTKTKVPMAVKGDISIVYFFGPVNSVFIPVKSYFLL